MLRTPQFTLHSIKGQVGSLFLVEYPTKLLLLDSGCATDVPTVQKYIRHTLCRPLSDVALVMVTHVHPDHMGGGHLWRGAGVPIAAPSDLNRWYAGAHGCVQHRAHISLAYYFGQTEHKYLGTVPSSVVRQHGFAQKYGATNSAVLLPFWLFLASLPILLYYPRHLPLHYPLHDNSLLPMFEDWQVMLAPGHTSHQMVVYHKQEQILYASDLLLQHKKRFSIPFPIDFPKWHIHTLERLKSLPVKSLLLAHGGLVDIEAPQGFQHILQPLIDRMHTPYLSPLHRWVRRLFFPHFTKEIRRVKREGLHLPK
eukprot:NODE_3206_length_1011_cov_14.621041_g3061_i0.p1 GENE.NODE_3206_length_1011_cov_14.621041_g3061_i0~~NODE_3206_length_1011_cov_14.621041_g3061_i0.p1  ORF type:complete len:326 (-),score=64.32 NODE_3206_length_1011_cov_14.621041_g3061_i0:33-962(-)